jgi:hypothetical protein
MRLIGKTSSVCCVVERMTQPNQSDGEPNAGLALISVRRHVHCLLECAKQLKWWEACCFCDISQPNILIDVMLEEVAC